MSRRRRGVAKAVADQRSGFSGGTAVGGPHTSDCLGNRRERVSSRAAVVLRKVVPRRGSFREVAGMPLVWEGYDCGRGSSASEF